MLSYIKKKEEFYYQIIHLYLHTIFIYLLYKSVFGKTNIEGIIIFISSILFSIYLYLKKNTIFPRYSLFVLITPAIILGLQYFFHHIPVLTTVPNTTITIDQIFSMYNLNYTYGLAFLFFPFLIINSHYSYKSLFKLILGFSIVYILYNIYIGLKLHFNRDDLAVYFKVLITYDSINILLAGLLYIYSFYLYETLAKKWLSFLVLFIATLSLIINITHGTRGTWLVLPFLFSITIPYYFKSCKQYFYQQLATLIFIGSIIIGLKSELIFSRIIAAYQDFSLFHSQPSTPTSIGSRLTMWQHAITDFEHSPIVGISTFKVSEQVCHLSQTGIITGNCLTHMHSIYFQELASHGMIGFIGLLLSFILPMSFLYKIKPILPHQKLCKAAALFTIISTMICGLTDFYFITAVASSVYYCFVLTLCAFLVKTTDAT